MIKNKEAEILLLGLPNSGKSTLINALTKNKTSIIGSKPNTTRDKISKFVTYENDKNILISDLPGFLETPDEFNINYQNNIDKFIKDADKIQFLISVKILIKILLINVYTNMYIMNTFLFLVITS